MKTTSSRSQPQNFKSGISQQTLFRSSLDLKLTLRKRNQNWRLLKMKTASNGRRPPNIKSGTSKHPLVLFAFSAASYHWQSRWITFIYSDRKKWIVHKYYLGAVQVSHDQNEGRGGVCQMIWSHLMSGLGGSQPNDHMITHQGDPIYVFYEGHNKSCSTKFKVLEIEFNTKELS